MYHITNLDIHFDNMLSKRIESNSSDTSTKFIGLNYSAHK